MHPRVTRAPSEMVGEAHFFVPAGQSTAKSWSS